MTGLRQLGSDARVFNLPFQIGSEYNSREEQTDQSGLSETVEIVRRTKRKFPLRRTRTILDSDQKLS